MRVVMSVASFFSAFLIALCGSLFNRQAPVVPENLNEFPRQCRAVIFDLGGVLVETNKSKAMWELGPSLLFSYWKSGSDVHALKSKFYEILDKVAGKTGNPYGVKDEDGKLIPALMAAWLRGDRPNKKILEQISAHIEENPEWFANTTEQKIIANMADMIFTPERFVKTRKIIAPAAKFVKKCKEQGFKVYVLSNWDAESSKLMIKKHDDLFELFDGIIISGDVKAVKPEPAIFKCITDCVPAHECVYFDDQPENLRAARTLGIHSILINKESPIKEIQEQVALIQPIGAKGESAYA